MSRSASEDLPQTAIIRYSRDSLLQFNVPNYDAQLTLKIIECLKPFKIDKGNSESVVKTDSKRPPVDFNNFQKKSNPNSPMQSSLNLNSNLQNRVTPLRSPAAAAQVLAPRTPLLAVNNQITTPKQRLTPKFQPVAGSTLNNLNLSNSSLKENENQNLNKKLPKTTPNKKLTVAYQPKTPSTSNPLFETRALKSIDSNSSPSLTKMSLSSPSSPICSPMSDTPASPIIASPMCPTSPSKTPGSTDCSPKTSPSKLETDPHRLQQRQKQIDYGYKTLGYIKYRLEVPKETRTKEQPKTPKKSQFCSKRSWDGQVKKWRRELHLWDPTDPKECEPYFDENLLISLFEGSLEVESIKKQLEEQVEELRVNGRLLLSPNDKHLAKLTNSKSSADSSDISSGNTADVTYADTQPNRIFPIVDSPSSANYIMDDESYNVPNYLQKQPIARVLVFSAEC